MLQHNIIYIKDYTMFLLKLKTFLQGVLAANYQTELDQFITSKNPTSTAEVEYWIRHFDRNHAHGY
jgi:hypothetical protein